MKIWTDGMYSAGFILALGLISPFYEPATSFGSGLIGLLILFWAGGGGS